jgi:PleD family two-component response regulator
MVLFHAALEEGLRHAEGLLHAFSAIAVESPAGRAAATLSAGVAQWRTGESPTQLFHRADAALYRAKANGRSRVEPEETS